MQYIGPFKDSIHFRNYPAPGGRENKIDFRIIRKLESGRERYADSNLIITLDTTQMVGIEALEYGSDRLQIKRNKYNAYPVLISSASTNFIAIGIGNILAIEVEAMDEKGLWQNIEKMFVLKCGTGLATIWLKTGDIALTTVPVYAGNYKTMLRLKLFDSYSQPFSASINKALLPAK